jgi:hypothetical protein
MKTLEGTNPSAHGAHVYIGPAGSRSGLGRSIVTIVQPAESLLRMDPTRSYGRHPAFRCPFLKSEMRTVLMMVTNILGEQSLQMAFIQRNNLVQQMSPTASHPTLRDAILPGTPEGSSVAGELLFHPRFLGIPRPATILRCAIWWFFSSIFLLPWSACSDLAVSVP